MLSRRAARELHGNTLKKEQQMPVGFDPHALHWTVYRYLHDTRRVALCPDFVRGGSEACPRGADCLLSHDLSDADRMPPCPSFLQVSTASLPYF